jgi:alpha-beta hydrolase superfamily lysophospholipase
MRWAGLFLGALALMVLGGIFYIYGVLPGKIAQSIVAKVKVRKPITQTPADYGMPDYESVTFKTPDGIPLAAWWIPADKKVKKQDVLATILLTHGLFKNREQMLSRAVFLHRLGCRILLFDQRGEGESGDAPLTGGILESKDFPAAWDYLDSRHLVRGPLVFFGFSLGSISALRAGVQSGSDEETPIAVIADSPLANLKSYISRRTAGAKFADLPGFLTRVLAAYDQVAGLSLKEEDLDLLPVVKRMAGVPTVYITGEKDDLAKSEEVRKLFEATESRQKRLIYIPDAGHEETYKQYPIIYEKVVEEFLRDLKAGFPKKEEGSKTVKTKKKGHSTHPMK